MFRQNQYDLNEFKVKVNTKTIDTSKMYNKTLKGTHIPMLPARLLFVGKSNSGKTHKIRDLLKNHYSKVCKCNIIVMSPTIQFDRELKDLADYTSDEYDDSLIPSIINQQKGIMETKGDKAIPHVLIVMDDLMHSAAFRPGSSLWNEYFRIRHYNISLIIVCQKFRSVNPMFRNNSSKIYIFPVVQSEVDAILREHASKKTRRCLLDALQYINNSEGYDYLSIDYDKKQLNKMFSISDVKPLTFCD